MILLGDDGQLPPVQDHACYHKHPVNMHATAGQNLYLEFTDVIQLIQVYRQQDPVFADCLARIRNYSATINDINLLKSRLKDAVDEETRLSCTDAPHLFGTRADVQHHNLSKLAEWTPLTPGSPIQAAVARIRAFHTGPRDAAKASSDQAGGLPEELLLKVGARVMLKMNLCVPRGLVNGAMGTVINIVYEEEMRPPELPHCILIQFDHYHGESCSSVLPRVVPIYRQRTTFTINDTECSRTQFPLMLGWAITVHK